MATSLCAWPRVARSTVSMYDDMTDQANVVAVFGPYASK